LSTQTKPTAAAFNDLCRLEPALVELRDECLFYRENWNARRSWRRWEKLACWYGYPASPFPGIKPRLVLLVGWGRPDGDQILGTREAYDVAYHFLLDELGA
jgi:hypothetical protein